MKIIKINAKEPDQKTINLAARVINSGGVVVFPVDTSYGLAADATNKQAIDKVFKIKGRSKAKELSVIVKDIPTIDSLCELSESNREYLNRYLPGQITIILKLKQPMAGIMTLGARIPGTELTNKLSAVLDHPYSATSANPSGLKPAHTSEEVSKYFENSPDGPDLFLDAGNISEVPSSTVVDLTDDKPKVLRQGAVVFQ